MVAFRFSVVVPNLAPEAGIHGPNVVRRSEVEDAVYFERSGFKLLACGINPGERKRLDVGGVDLVERAEAPARVVAVVGGPRIGGGFEKSGGIEALRDGERCAQAQSKKQQDCDSSLLRSARKHCGSSLLIHVRASLLQAFQIRKEIVNVRLRKLV